MNTTTVKGMKRVLMNNDISLLKGEALKFVNSLGIRNIKNVTVLVNRVLHYSFHVPKSCDKRTYAVVRMMMLNVRKSS